MAAALKIKGDEETPGDALNCPSCGAPLTSDAVICVQCGYDRRTGRKLEEKGSSPARKILMFGGGAVVILLGVVLLLMNRGHPQKTSPPAPVSVAPVAAAPEPAPAPAPEPAATAPVEQAVEPAAETVASSSSVASAPETVAPAAPSDTTTVATSPEAEPAPAVDRAKIEAEQLQVLTARLDEKFPLFAQGESVALRLNNGVVKRGEFSGIKGESIVIAISSNETEAIDFSLLDRASRVRCDPAYRVRFVEFQVQQRVDDLVQNPDSTNAASGAP